MERTVRKVFLVLGSGNLEWDFFPELGNQAASTDSVCGSFSQANEIGTNGMENEESDIL